MTQESNSEEIVAALAMGANDCVSKPLNFDVLFARVEAQLAMRRQAESRTKSLLAINRTLRIELAARKRAATASLLTEVPRYQQFYDDTPSIFFTLDAGGKILSVNRFGAHYMGYSVAELLGQTVHKLVAEQDRITFAERLTTSVAAPETVHRWEMYKLHKSGQHLWVRDIARAAPGAHGRVNILIASEDISDTHYLAQQLSHQASHDELTGLVNRREFERRLQRVLKAAREERSEHALCCIDLDKFKIINDTCGHVAGDELLRQVATLLQRGVRSRDTVARLGGDEFGILLEHCAPEQARQIANGLRQIVDQFRFSWDQSNFHIGASVGLVPIDGSSGDMSSVLSAADSACYVAKEAGRNRMHEYCESDTLLARRDTEIQRVLKIDRALEEDRWVLFYQPIVALNGAIDEGSHYELLIRMRDDDGIPAPAGKFIATAERFNMITRIDRWVLNAAFTWLAAHPAQLERTSLCAINISGHSLADEEFCRAVIQQFEETGVPFEKICFEITETAAIVNMAKTIRFMATFKTLGCQFSLDDFGSGLSSFAYLKNLPVDYLKIDGQFVKDIVEDSSDMEMVRSINGIGHVMGKKTIAEFVENEAILTRLREMGVDYAQGYYLGAPRPLDEFV
ncbi:MAG: EAL domain-containing protein [Gammaproteobacteria bacterium]|nr:EAL domain-containing protein [Gammaproteobacteria bacterium]